MNARIEFVENLETKTTSFVVDGVEMGMWFNEQPPAWAKALVRILTQRARISQ